MVKKIDAAQLEFNDAYQKTLFWFFSFPDMEFSLSDLADELEISKKTANRVVSKLEQENFLKKEVIGKVWRLRATKEHIFAYSKKIPYTLMQLYEIGIVQMIRETIPNAKAIILFGSYRKGDDIESSDIDIAVEVTEPTETKSQQLGVVKEFFSHRKNISINLTIFSRNEVDPNLFANIANGIVLDGFLEVNVSSPVRSS